MAATTAPVADPSTTTELETEEQHAPRYHVILFDDDTHSYEYVIEMMIVLLGMSAEQGFQVAYDVDHVGQATVLTAPYERAVEVRQQIITYGPDPRMVNSTGSMAAMIERAGD